MPWKTTIHQQRLNFIAIAVLPGVNFRDLCRKFAISAPTGCKWLARYRATGADGFHELSRQPPAQPSEVPCPLAKGIDRLAQKASELGCQKAPRLSKAG